MRSLPLPRFWELHRIAASRPGVDRITRARFGIEEPQRQAAQAASAVTYEDLLAMEAGEGGEG